ncbi:MAG TPA: xanthine dehydrogenase family protein subunit M [Terriglobales bacterium]|nr:xanthine dehydrogenase family protein subunit M [Terriglobales bacterium]
MYPRPFTYHRAASLKDAAATLAELGPEAKLLAGGQSLVPLMKLRLSSPAALIDVGHIQGLNYIRAENGAFRIGALARHTDMAQSAAARHVPILHDCAAGIADVQVRNWGTVVGSIAEADPTGDWAPVLLVLDTEVECLANHGRRSLGLAGFIQDAFTTALRPGEVMQELRVKATERGSGGCYLAFKRCAPVYASASVAVQLALEGATCRQARVALGAVALTPVVATESAKALEGSDLNAKSIARAAEAAAASCEPPCDGRGSTEYKRALIRKLFTQAVNVAARRARGESVEVSHHYA